MAADMIASLQREAIAALEAGRPDEVWLGLEPAFRYLAATGHDPRALLEAVIAGRIQVRYFGDLDPVPECPEPRDCGVNAGALLRWIATQTRRRTLH